MSKRTDVEGLALSEPADDHTVRLLQLAQSLFAESPLVGSVKGRLSGAHFAEVYRNRLAERMRQGRPHRGMAAAVQRLSSFPESLSVRTLSSDSCHAVLFLDAHGQLVTGFLEPDLQYPTGARSE